MARSSAGFGRRGVLGKHPEAVAHVTPNLRQVAPSCFGALLVEAVKVPVARLLIGHEPSFVEQTEVTRDCGPADREVVGDLLDRSRLPRQQLKNGATVRIPQRVKWIVEPGTTYLHVGVW